MALFAPVPFTEVSDTDGTFRTSKHVHAERAEWLHHGLVDRL